MCWVKTDPLFMLGLMMIDVTFTFCYAVSNVYTEIVLLCQTKTHIVYKIRYCKYILSHVRTALFTHLSGKYSQVPQYRKLNNNTFHYEIPPGSKWNSFETLMIL